MAVQQISLLDLPDEILQVVLGFLPAEALSRSQSTCKRLQQLSDHALLWRAQCEIHYHFWRPKHALPELLARPANRTDWKKIFLNRKQQDARILKDLDAILAGQQGRIPRIQRITDLEEDAKDVLLEQSRAPENAEDYLARTWFSKEILGAIERKLALETWSRLKCGEDIPLEHALGAFDLFIAERPPYTLGNISAHLDRIAAMIREENPEWSWRSPRSRAIIIAEFLHLHSLVGVTSEALRHNLQNNLISIALWEADHQSMPLISVAIFCCISQRLGLDARPCCFPFHVLAVIFAPPDLTMDNDPVPSGVEAAALDTMYMDPYYGFHEISPNRLHSELEEMAVPREQHAPYLAADTTLELVRRTARNIIRSLRDRQIVQPPSLVHSVLAGTLDTTFASRSQPPPSATVLPSVRAKYAVYWITLILGVDPPSENPQILRMWNRNQLSQFVDTFEAGFAMFDVALVEKYLVSIFRMTEEGRTLQSILRSLRETDAGAVVPKLRGSTNSNITFRIGQHFRHKRYNYNAMIIGWSPHCAQSEDWIEHMRVDSLSRGRHQPFYNVIDETGTDRHVAEENIVPYGEPIKAPGDALMRLAGRWFKRWQWGETFFVSNLMDEYPEN